MLFLKCCTCHTHEEDGTRACFMCTHKRYSLCGTVSGFSRIWPASDKGVSEGESGSHGTTMTKMTTTVSTSTQATPFGSNSALAHIFASGDDSEAEDGDEDDKGEEEEVDGYLIATTLLNYSNLAEGHGIKKDTPYEACCKCDWCPCSDLAARKCPDCDHLFCDGCRFQQWVPEAEIEAMGAWDGAPVFGRLRGGGGGDDDDTSCSEDSLIGSEAEHADFEGEGEEESLHERSTALMEEALKQLTEAIRRVFMGTLMEEASEAEEQKDLDNLLWRLDLD
ncbi:MAG: hypothetical protein Q9207_002687 [Kuettlingeria erythrocarpa]